MARVTNVEPFLRPVRKYSYLSRNTRTRLVRTPLRHREKPTRQLTRAEKAVASARRRTHKKEVNEALEESMKVIKREADKLSERFGRKRSHWEQILMQQSTFKTERKVSVWQAWMSLWAKTHPAGK